MKFLVMTLGTLDQGGSISGIEKKSGRTWKDPGRIQKLELNGPLSTSGKFSLLRMYDLDR